MRNSEIAIRTAKVCLHDYSCSRINEGRRNVGNRKERLRDYASSLDCNEGMLNAWGRLMLPDPQKKGLSHEEATPLTAL